MKLIKCSTIGKWLNKLKDNMQLIFLHKYLLINVYVSDIMLVPGDTAVNCKYSIPIKLTLLKMIFINHLYQGKTCVK